MKNLKKLLLVILICLVAVPNIALAKETKYNTLNLEQALTEEEISHDFSNYKETDDQVVIYLFRGKGCGYCKKFLTFLNSIVDDYGKYFKVESYEVWHDQQNSELMNQISEFMGEDASGVPFIIIGDKAFTGYSEKFDDEIKNKIKELYEQDKSERYDVMEEYEKQNKDVNAFGIIAFDILFTVATVIGLGIYSNKKISLLEERISELESKKNQK